MYVYGYMYFLYYFSYLLCKSCCFCIENKLYIYYACELMRYSYLVLESPLLLSLPGKVLLKIL